MCGLCLDSSCLPFALSPLTFWRLHNRFNSFASVCLHLHLPSSASDDAAEQQPQQQYYCFSRSHTHAQVHGHRATSPKHPLSIISWVQLFVSLPFDALSLSRLLSLLISALSRKQNSPGARHKRVQTCYLSVYVCVCESEGVRAPVPVGFCLWGGRNTVMHYVCVCMRVSFQGQGNSIFCRCHSYDYYHYYYYYCCCC